LSTHTPAARIFLKQVLKLTTYFGERDRAGGRLVADALLDLYGKHEVQSSMLLRGMEGFGLEHHLRTDRLLTLSEDLPVVSIALDTPERIERLLGPVREIQQRGLVTLERARMLRGVDAQSAAAVAVAAIAAETRREATKLTVYLGRHERAACRAAFGRAAFAEVCNVLHGEGVAGATVLLGVDGTHHGERRRARFFARNEQVPATIVAIGASEPIARAVSQLEGVLANPLLTVERVRVCKRDGETIAVPHEPVGRDEHGLELWQKLTVVSSEAARHEGAALHVELVRRLRAAGAAGVTSLRGIWGFHGEHAPHGDRLISLRRHVPVMTIAIDTPARMASLYSIFDELTGEQGLLTSEIVPAMAAAGRGETRGGLRLAATSASRGGR
jgi:PII-like signaling protein